MTPTFKTFIKHSCTLLKHVAVFPTFFQHSLMYNENQCHWCMICAYGEMNMSHASFSLLQSLALIHHTVSFTQVFFT